MIRDLTSAEAGERLKQHGYNELAGEGPKNIWRIALEVVREPMFLLLIGCGEKADHTRVARQLPKSVFRYACRFQEVI